MNKSAMIVLAIFLVVSCANHGQSPVGHTINVGSHSLHAVIAGNGSPAVVFDGGIGASSEEYRDIQNRIAEKTTVVIYDRAGYGASKAGPLPRDSRSEMEELRIMLTELKISPPYILVGHSLGGLNIQVYAGLHPEEVAGMVLLDPPPLSFIMGKEYKELASMATQMTDEWQSVADSGLRSENMEERVNAEFFQMLASEHREMFGRSAQQASSIVSFGNTPLVVIASGVPNPMFGDVAESYQKYWAAQSETLTAKSARGQFVFVDKSTHSLHRDAVDLVVTKILSLVNVPRD